MLFLIYKQPRKNTLFYIALFNKTIKENKTLNYRRLLCGFSGI